MINQYLTLAERIPGIPSKKWNEKDREKELFLLMPLKTAHERLTAVLQAGSMEPEKFLRPVTKYEGSFDGRYFLIAISVPVRNGRTIYQFFGELTGDLNGCRIHVIVRDSNMASSIVTNLIYFGILFYIAGPIGGMFLLIISGILMGIVSLISLFFPKHQVTDLLEKIFRHS